MRNGKEDHLIYQTIKTGNEKKFRDHMTRQLYKDSRINLFSRFGYVVNDQIKCIHEYHQNMQLRRFRVSKDYSWNGNLHPKNSVCQVEIPYVQIGEDQEVCKGVLAKCNKICTFNKLHLYATSFN